MILNLCTTVTGAKIEYNNNTPEEFIKLCNNQPHFYNSLV